MGAGDALFVDIVICARLVGVQELKSLTEEPSVARTARVVVGYIEDAFSVEVVGRSLGCGSAALHCGLARWIQVTWRGRQHRPTAD